MAEGRYSFWSHFWFRFRRVLLRGELELKSIPTLPGPTLQGNAPWKRISLTAITLVFDSGRRKPVTSVRMPLQHEEWVTSWHCPLLNQLPSGFKPFPGIQCRQFQGPDVRETSLLQVAWWDKRWTLLVLCSEPITSTLPKDAGNGLFAVINSVMTRSEHLYWRKRTCNPFSNSAFFYQCEKETQN